MSRLSTWTERRQTSAGPHRRRQTDRAPHTGWRAILSIGLLTACIDWWTKALVINAVPEGKMTALVDGHVMLWHVKNPAMVLGLFGNLEMGTRKVVALLMTLVLTVLLLEVGTRAKRLLPRRRKWAWLFLGLVMGGMVGNLGERAIHWGITDFLSIRVGDVWLPPGNFADLAIFLSIPVAFLVIVFELEARAQRRPGASYRVHSEGPEGSPG
jgi:signal peptidase II